MASNSSHTISRRLPALVAVLVVFAISVSLPILQANKVNAERLQNRSLELSDNQPDATNVNYKFSFTFASTDVIGSMRFQLCENDPFIDTPCDAPPGLDLTGATLTNQQGELGFTISNLSTANVEILSRSPGSVTLAGGSYTLSGVKNPSVPETLYARIQTYASTDATGTNVDYGALAWDIENAIGVSTEVPPYLTFCSGITIDGFDCSQASGNYINFGSLSANATRLATSQLMVATNAAGGYAIRLAGNTLTSNNNIIPAMTGTTSRVGTSQFGINFRQNSNPFIGSDPAGFGIATVDPAYDIPNTFRFGSGEVIATASTASDYSKLTASYIVNIVNGEPPGVYISTISYICLANF